jgi:Flp pilus assembly protein TadG
MARVFKITALTLASRAARNCTSKDDGAVLVEAAIVLPVMVLVILGGLDLGIGMLAATRLNFATESAAKCGALAVPGCADAASTTAFAVAQSGAPASAFFVSPVSQCAMETVSASYAYSFQFLPWTVTLQSSASYPANCPPSS